jgi:p-hydroxybenzoate 3-monooxygenase
MSKGNVDVCIVGAGPAGLVLAHLLHRAGISFVVLELQEADALRARVKAGLIEHRTVELLKPHGLADPILERGRENGTCEFRADGTAFVLDYGALSGGRGHYIYPQQELVGDWVEALLAAGGDVRFGVAATSVEQDADGATVNAVHAASGEPLRIRCGFVAGCDGAASRLAASASEVTTVGTSHPSRWLTLIAAVPPSSERTIYGLHPSGFAGQLRRSPTLTRFMLEVPADEGLEVWPDGRIWRELHERLAAADRPPLAEGEFIERDVLDLRVRVSEPMQSGRLFLAGDAAHLITPAGGKGMNLAIQDAVELAAGLCEEGGERLARYSETRLPTVWRYQEFSNLMLGLFHAGADGVGFAHRLRLARLDRLLHDPQLSRWFAHAYAGVDSV